MELAKSVPSRLSCRSRHAPCSPLGLSSCCFSAGIFPSGLFESGSVFLWGSPGPCRIGDSLAFPEEVINSLEVFEIPEENTGERHCFIGEREAAWSRQRRIRVGVLPQEIMGRTLTSGLVLLPSEGCQKSLLFRPKLHGFSPRPGGGVSLPW